MNDDDILLNASAGARLDPACRRAEDLTKRFQADCELRGVQPYIYVFYAGKFIAFLGARGKDPVDVDREDLKAFLISLKERGLKPQSTDRVFNALSQLYEFLIDEEEIAANPILPFRKRYLRKYKDDKGSSRRQLISIDQASMLVNSVLNSRDKAIIVLLFKTGMRRGELQRLDVSDIDMEKMEITLKPTAKRSNRLLFFDHETAEVLRIWLKARKSRIKGSDALFPSRQNDRLCSREIKDIVIKHATRVGLHNPNSERLEDRFTPHCCRHWFTAHLYRAGMSRERIMFLRGDAPLGAFEGYLHIKNDMDGLRECYLAYIPQLGV